MEIYETQMNPPGGLWIRLQESDKILVEGHERFMNPFGFSNEDLAQVFLSAGYELNKAFACSYRVVVHGESPIPCYVRSSKYGFDSMRHAALIKHCIACQEGKT